MHTPSRKLILAQIFLIFILPVSLLFFKILPLNWRIILLTVSALFIYGIIHHEKWTHLEMGIRHDNFKKSLLPYFIFTVVSFFVLFMIAHKMQIREIDNKMFLLKTWIFFIPISFFQEFAYRSFLIPRLEKVFNSKYVVIIVNALLFTFLHIIYPSLGIVLPLVFVSGILFAWLYIKYPNLVLISIAHSILNVTALLLGFFVIS